MGVVYEAQDPNIGRIVALKVLRPDRITTETFVNRFLKEAKVIGRLSHPNIVTIHDVGEDQGTVYIAMEFLEGTALSDMIKDKHLEPRDVVDIAMQIAETLEYAHQKGVIHRDIKPSNIVVQADNRIKITDFGIAHIEDPSATVQTQAGEIMGTPAYMSPEQIQGQPVDGRTDIFSLGVILYEMSTGQRPFGKGKSLATIFNDIMQHTPEEPCKTSPLIPVKLSDIIMKALSKEPDERFQSGREMAEALRQSLVAAQPAEPAVIKEPPATRSYAKPAGVIMAIAVAVAGIAYLLPGRSTVDKEKPAERPAATESVQRQAVPVPAAPPATIVKPAPEPPKPVAAPPPEPALPKPLPAKPTPKVSPRPAELPPPVKTKAPPEERPAPVFALKPLPKFAFLKVQTVPKGASIYVNGEMKGKSPLRLKLGLGEYQVRLASPGYLDSEQTVKLEKMTGYPLIVKLKPVK
ncbi:putative serine/threonine-protein kinase [Geobacter sp. OR-1]|nr:putative serine/threonine-protein kinase [Geobacter sp. OR-1]